MPLFRCVAIGQVFLDILPPPRTHRHRYFGVLAPNSPLRAAAVAFATPAQPATAQADPAIAGEGAPGVAPLGHAVPTQTRAGATQALTGALPVGGVDRTHL